MDNATYCASLLLYLCCMTSVADQNTRASGELGKFHDLTDRYGRLCEKGDFGEALSVAKEARKIGKNLRVHKDLIAEADAWINAIVEMSKLDDAKKQAFVAAERARNQANSCFNENGKQALAELTRAVATFKTLLGEENVFVKCRQLELWDMELSLADQMLIRDRLKLIAEFQKAVLSEMGDHSCIFGVSKEVEFEFRRYNGEFSKAYECASQLEGIYREIYFGEAQHLDAMRKLSSSMAAVGKVDKAVEVSKEMCELSESHPSVGKHPQIVSLYLARGQVLLVARKYTEAYEALNTSRERAKTFKSGELSRETLRLLRKSIAISLVALNRKDEANQILNAKSFP